MAVEAEQHLQAVHDGETCSQTFICVSGFGKRPDVDTMTFTQVEVVSLRLTQ